MAKPRITHAAVTAAYEIFDSYSVPEDYYTVSSDEQRQIRISVVRQALIAAQLAGQRAQSSQTNVEPVQDTYFVDRKLPIMALSGDVESDRVLKLHFRRPVSDDDRKALVDAINLYQASLAATGTENKP